MDTALYVAAGVATFAGVIFLIRKQREYVWGWCRNNSDLSGKVFIVTGANVGLGYEVTKELLKRKAKVVMACRSRERASEAVAKIRMKISEGETDIQELDLSDFSSIKSFCKVINEKYPVFHCLINNAGIATKLTDVKTKQGIEIHTGTNHVGHFLLTQLLMESIKKNNSRVVILSSKLHEKGTIDFDHFGVVRDEKYSKYYNDSKLMNFYFAKELYDRGIDVHVLCPGLCMTNLFRDYNPKFYHYILLSPIMLFFLRSGRQGAQNVLHCALDNVNTEEKNPSKSYIVMNLKQKKSKITLDNEISKRLWTETEKLCQA